MVNRCNAAGVNVIADLVINHMTGHGQSGTGTGGTIFFVKSISHEILRENDFTKNVYTFSHRFHGFFLN